MSFITPLPLCVHVSVRPCLFFSHPLQNEYPLPFHLNTHSHLDVKRSLRVAGRQITCWAEAISWQTSLNISIISWKTGDNTSYALAHLTLRPSLLPSSFNEPQNWTRTNLSHLLLLQMMAFIWGWCCLIFETFHLSSGCLSLFFSQIGFHFDHHIENIRVESEMNLVSNEAATAPHCTFYF